MVGGTTGWKAKSLFVDSAEVKALKRAEEKRLEQEEIIAELERKYLDEQQKRKVIYRDKIKEVVKYVDNDTCTVTDDGLRLINEALTGPSQ